MNATNDALFRALADPTRRAIFEQLCRDGEASVSHLTKHAGVSQPVVSKHLGKLKRAGLVSHRAAGRSALYHPKPEALVPITDWTAQMTRFWSDRLVDLEGLLQRMDQ